MLEKKIENRLKEKTKLAGGMCIKMAIISYAGLPDRLVLLPKQKMFFAELKSPGQTPSRLQEVVHERIRGLGFVVHVLDSMEGVDAIFA